MSNVENPGKIDDFLLSFVHIWVRGTVKIAIFNAFFFQLLSISATMSCISSSFIPSLISPGKAHGSRVGECWQGRHAHWFVGAQVGSGATGRRRRRWQVRAALAACQRERRQCRARRRWRRRIHAQQPEQGRSRHHQGFQSARGYSRVGSSGECDDGISISFLVVAHARTHARTHTHTHIHTRTYTHAHTHTHTHIPIPIYTHHLPSTAGMIKAMQLVRLAMMSTIWPGKFLAKATMTGPKKH